MPFSNDENHQDFKGGLQLVPVSSGLKPLWICYFHPQSGGQGLRLISTICLFVCLFVLLVCIYYLKNYALVSYIFTQVLDFPWLGTHGR